MRDRLLMGLATGTIVALIVMLVICVKELSRATRGELTARAEFQSSEKKRTDLIESYAKSQANARQDAVKAIDKLLELEAKLSAAKAEAVECEAEAAASLPPPRRPAPAPAIRKTTSWVE